MESRETYKIIEQYPHDVCLVENKKSQLALINISTNKIIIPFGSYTYETKQNQLYLQGEDGKKGYCDISKGIYLPPTFTNIEIQICKRALNSCNETIDYIIYYLYYTNEEGIEVCDILYFEDENVDSKILPIDVNRTFLENHKLNSHQTGPLKPLALECHELKKINDKYKSYKDQNGQMNILFYVEPEYHQQYHNSGNLITRSLDATRIITPTDLDECKSDYTKYRNILILLKENNGKITYGIYWGREIYSHKEKFLIPPKYKNIIIERNRDSTAYIFICEKQNGKFELKIEYYDSQKNQNKPNDLNGEYESIKYVDKYVILINGSEIKVYDINTRILKEASQDQTNSSIVFIKVDNKYHIYDINAKKRIAIINFKLNYETLNLAQGNSIIKINEETIDGKRIRIYDPITTKEYIFFPVSSFRILTINNKTVIEVEIEDGRVFTYESGKELIQKKEEMVKTESIEKCQSIKSRGKYHTKKRIKLNKNLMKGRYRLK